MENKAYKIITQNLCIRCYDFNDAKLLKDSIDESIIHLSEFMPWAKFEPETISQKEDRIINWIDNFNENKDFIYGIFNRNNSKLFGGTGLHTRQGEGILEIGYWINVNEANKGYATEATKALMFVAFNIIGIEKLEIRCNSLNTNSIKIPTKLGFTNEYEFRVIEKDKAGNRFVHKVFTMFKEEYLNNQFDKIKIFDLNNNIIL
ncbi:MAG: GNAT family N-acetyltransferase [Chlorobiota bacterium]|nr:GNAT family N-acetyltransferase [Chlorobiota bacterium]QQS65999.1 MAG: GNAT family N-acetyltransferase [Chlorobiota bacterium]